uniref:Uncharacterized protein LOC113794884 n=1 Tax=Dermatophagoides pteronyssinus TaxID=6956 RepID=A0A6P6Y6A9_DERPT
MYPSNSSSTNIDDDNQSNEELNSMLAQCDEIDNQLIKMIESLSSNLDKFNKFDQMVEQLNQAETKLLNFSQKLDKLFSHHNLSLDLIDIEQNQIDNDDD